LEKKKDWKGENDRHSKSKKADHRDNAPKPETLKDPVVYFTVAIATDIPPKPLLMGSEWNGKQTAEGSFKSRTCSPRRARW